MKMMKKLYLCLLMLTLVGAITVTAQEKKEKTKTEKVKKEKKAKKEKAQKEKAPKAPKAQAERKSKSSGSSESQKKPKAGTVEFDANQKASIVAMDSLLRNYRQISNELTMEHIWRFADMQCERFKNDPNFMVGIADLFWTSLGNEGFADQRYSEIKKMYPTNMEVYMKEAWLFFGAGWRDHPSYNPDYLLKAKVQVDSAKIVSPNSPDPYIRWAFWQAPYRAIRQTGYENLSVDNELAELKKKFPNEPCYRQIANHYYYDLMKRDGISDDDRTNYIVYANEFYGKEDRNLLRNNDIVDYAELSARVNSLEALNQANEILDYGISRDPNYPYFYRYKFWIEAALARSYRAEKETEKSNEYWGKAMESGELFFEKADTLRLLSPDFETMADIYLQNKKYAEALVNLDSLLALNYITDLSRASALRDKIDCFNNLERFEEAIDAYSAFETFKKEHEMPMTIHDYLKITPSYNAIINDTLKDSSVRLHYVTAIDSVYNLMGEVSPENIGYVCDQRMLYTRIKLGITGGGFDSPDMYTAGKRLIDTITELQANQSEAEKDETDTYYLMEGYYFVMQYYTNQEGTTGWDEAFKMSEIILYEMPMSMELVKLSASRKRQYDQWYSTAERLNGIFKKNGYGKKKKK